MLGTVLAHAARGVLAAMAMSWLRALTKGLGLLPKTPPEKVFEEGVPEALAPVPPQHRDEAIELAHWAYGAAGGVLFALLPAAVRRRALAGPLYGIATWAWFDGVVAPALGVRWPHARPAAERVSTLADHVVYGLIVAGRRP